MTLCLCSSACFHLTRGSYTDLEAAEQALRTARYDEAIASYERHLNYRLNVEDRPKWENPHFYLLFIGDVYLRKNDPTQALSSYLTAREHGIDIDLISDRLRGLARWYEQRKQFTEAFNILESYRDLDPLLFETMLDRIARTLTEQEASAAVPPPEQSHAPAISLRELPSSDGSASPPIDKAILLDLPVKTIERQ